MSQVSYGTITITDTNDIESITVEYNRNQSSSNAPSATDTNWSTTRPDWAQGYYIWQRTRVHKSGTTADKDVIGTAVCITGSTGQTGTSVTISSIKYAVSTIESQPTDSSFTYTSVPTVAEGSWLWTLVTYSNGSKAYTKSKQGVSGDSITVSKVEYQSGTSPTSAPTGTWQTSIPTVAEGNYLWTKTTYSDGNYTYSVAKQGKSGTSVSISSTSTTYQVSTSPTTTPTGEWKSTVQSTTTGQYLWTRTIVTYSDGNSTTSYSVAAHGATGTSISISSIKYAVSSTDSQPADSSFTYTSVPTVNEGQWLWTLTTYSNGSKMYTKSKQGKSGNDGQSLTATKTEYTIAANNVTINSSNHTSYTWTTNTPDYDASKPAYWGRITNTYANPAKTEYLFYKDEAITKAVADAAIANSIATHANEDAQGAMSQAANNVSEVKRIWFLQNASGAPNKPTSSTTIYSDNAANHWTTVRPTVTGYRYYYYCEQTTTGGGIKSWSDVYLDLSEFSEYEIGAMKTRFQNFFYPGDSNYPGAYAVGKSNSDGLDREDISTYGYNLRLTPTALSIGYNAIKTIEIDGATPALRFYKPSKTSQGTQTAQLDANGLVLSEGGIESGSVTSGNGYIYLSTANKGSVVNTLVPTPSGGTPKTDWRAVIGSKFGVDSDGNLYANNATISGAITVQAGSDLSAGLSDYSTTTDMNTAINTATGNLSTTISNTYATKTEAVVKEQRVYRRFTSAQSTFSGLNTWVTSGNGYTAWSTNVPQLTNGTTSYPFLYMSTQTQTATQAANNGTGCSFTTPRLNAMTTVIDGNSIIANSIAAGKINVENLQALSADMGTLTAGKITKGNNTIDFDNGTLEFKNQSTWTATTQGIKYDSTGLAIKGAITATSLTLGTGVKLNAETDINNLASVATTGSYNDLSNKPTIPSLTGYIHTDGTIGSTAAEGANSFTVASSGALTASNAIIYGTLYASKGYVGGWRIGTDGNKSLHNGTTDTSPTINNNTIILSKGLTSTTSVAGSTGEQTWTIVAGTNFGVTTGGKLYATGANINGAITATSLTISNGASVSGVVVPSQIADMATTQDISDLDTAAQGYAANASYSVEIKATSIDYTANTATLVATPFYQGGNIPSGTTLTYTWYKDSIASANIVGSNSNTLNITNTTAMGLNRVYICVISK